MIIFLSPVAHVKRHRQRIKRNIALHIKPAIFFLLRFNALGKEVRHFAYPYGLFNDAVRDAVIAAGYRAACSTRSGFNRPGEDPYLLRRIDVFGTDRLWQFRQKLRFGSNESSRLYALRYYASRLRSRMQSL